MDLHHSSGAAAGPSGSSPAPAADQPGRPRYAGRDIWDWEPEIARLKRQNAHDQALEVAVGCMNAMAEVARHDPTQVMEHYVIQVTIIQHKMGAYRDEISVIEWWLAHQLEPTRPDHRVDLRKRLAKAYELLAREEGHDPAPHRAQWRRLVAEHKAVKEQVEAGPAAARTGASRVAAGTARPQRPSGLVPGAVDLGAETFVAMDFETANRRGGVSACQIALVKMHRGEIIDRYATLIQPPPGWDRFEFTWLHGIGPADVRHAPRWADIADQVGAFVAGVPVFAHNASFDRKVWAELDEHFDTRTLPPQFYCSYRTAKNLIPGLVNYKLPTVLAACAPEYQLDHHRAESDAEACALIVRRLQQVVPDAES